MKKRFNCIYTITTRNNAGGMLTCQLRSHHASPTGDRMTEKEKK